VSAPDFSSARAFERNLGLIDPSEQRVLAGKRVALAGCGGVGGVHAHTLARLGVGRFRLADPDRFDVVNFNRQIGATVHTVGRSKAQVTAEMIAAINPEAEVEISEQPVCPPNLAAFLSGADLVIDGIDFFELPARRALLAAARSLHVPVLIAAPLGFSATLHVFAPGGMSFDDYFDLRDGQGALDQYTRFLLGLAPAALHAPYTDLSTADPARGRGPSSIIGSQLAACVAGAEALRILLGRGPSRLAPEFLQVDVYRRRLVSRRIPGGLRHPLQRVRLWLLARHLRRVGLDAAFAALAAA
jgi:molybdopterin/thiamine biosynthesis adenylyltransferase